MAEHQFIGRPHAADPSLLHVLGRLSVIEAVVRGAVAARRRVDPQPDEAFRGLYLSDRQLDTLLNRTADRVAGARDPLLAQVEAHADEAEAAGHPLRLRHLIREFGLTDTDVDALLCAAAPDLDPRFEKLYGYLQDDITLRRATVGLSIELAGSSPLDHAARGRFESDAPLLQGGLVTVEEPARPFLTRPLRVADRVTSFLLGSVRRDPTLHGLLRCPGGLASAEGTRMARAWTAGVRVVYCRQPPGDWAAAVTAAQDPEAIVVDMSHLVSNDVPGALAAPFVTHAC